MESGKRPGNNCQPLRNVMNVDPVFSTNYAFVSSTGLQGNHVPYDSLGHFLYNVVLCHAFFKMKTNYASLPVF